MHLQHGEISFVCTVKGNAERSATHSNAEILYVFGLGKLDAVGESLDRAVGRIVLYEELVNVFTKRPHHQAHHHALKNRVQIEELVGLKLQPFLLHLLLELTFTVLYLRQN